MNRRAKNLKTVLGQERERDRLKREALRKSKAEKAAMGMMDVDGDDEEEEPNCTVWSHSPIPDSLVSN